MYTDDVCIDDNMGDSNMWRFRTTVADRKFVVRRSGEGEKEEMHIYIYI